MKVQGYRIALGLLIIQIFSASLNLLKAFLVDEGTYDRFPIFRQSSKKKLSEHLTNISIVFNYWTSNNELLIVRQLSDSLIYQTKKSDFLLLFCIFRKSFCRYDEFFADYHENSAAVGVPLDASTVVGDPTVNGIPVVAGLLLPSCL